MRLVTSSTLLFWLLTALAAAAPPLTDELADAMQDRDYTRAVQVIDRELAENGKPGDYLLFLKGRALHFAGSDQEAIDSFRQFEVTYPASPWARHARFGLAISLSRVGDYRQAEEIYRSEAEFLLSSDRKQEVADIYLDSADELFDPKDDQEKPDFERANLFYQQALEVGTKPERTPAIEIRVVQCLQKLNKNDEAVARLNEFLKKYPEHSLVVEARFRLGQCQMSFSARDQARRTWRDLLSLEAPDEGWSEAQNELRAKAAFRLASTFGLPSAPDEQSLSLGITSLEKFIADFPQHELADDAFLLMARSYQTAQRFGDAAQVLQKFLDSERDGKLIPEALFLLGSYQQRQKKFDEALATWQDYLREYPAHGRWSDAQRSIIDTEYLKAQESQQSKRYDEARQAFLQFLAKYPLDQRAPQIMLHLGSMNHAKKQWDDAITDWRNVVTKYPKTDVASLAQLRIAQTIESKLNRPEEALDEYKKVEGSYQASAQKKIKTLTSKQVVIRTERVFRSSQLPEIKLTSRNVEQVDVRVYSIDLETYFRKMHLATGVESLDVSLIDPDRTFEFQVPDYARFRETEHAIPLATDRSDLNPSGVYVVTVSSETLEATTMVLQSDLDVIVKASRHEVFVYAQNMSTGEPWGDARLLISDGSRILGEGRTGDDGVFQMEFEELKNAGDVRVFAASGGNAASNLISLSGLQIARGLTPRGYIFTDRAAYRPGQLVNIKAIVRRVSGDVFEVEEEKKFDLRVIDPRNRTVWQEEVKLGEWGTAHSRFVLPAAAVQGTYRIGLTDNDKQHYQGIFQVQEFQLQNVLLRVDSDRDVYYRGERIEGTISAEYLFGGVLAGKSIRYQLGDGRTYTAKTDAQGQVKFDLETREYHESQSLPLRVELPDLNLATVRNYVLSATGFAISVDTPRPCYLSGESFPVQLKTADAKGDPLSQELTLRVFQQTVVRGQTAQVPVESHELKTDTAGRGQIKLQLSKGATYVLRAEGKDRFGNSISGSHFVQVSDQDDKVRLRILAERLTYKAGETARIRVHWREAPARALVTYQGARVLGYQIIKLKAGENKISVDLEAKHAPNFRLNVAVMTDDVKRSDDGRTARFHEASSDFFVQRDLRVEIQPLVDVDKTPLRPGRAVPVRVKTVDAQGNPVSTEVTLAMVQQAVIDRFGKGAASIQSFFRASHRASEVRTVSSIDFEYRPKTVRVSGLLLAERERLQEQEDELFDGIEEAFIQEGTENRPELASRPRFNMPRSNIANGQAQISTRLFRQGDRQQAGQRAPALRQLAESRDISGGQVPSPYYLDMDWAATGGVPQQGRALGQQLVQLDFEDASQLKAQMRGWMPKRASTVAAVYSNGIVNHVALGDGGASDWNRIAEQLAEEDAVLIAGDVAYETGYWNPSVTTDDQGVAEVEITMPDISTAWELIARGITKQTLVGQDKVKLVTRKPLFGQLKLPLAFSGGDQVRIPATIHNDAINNGDVRATLRVAIGGRSTEYLQGVSFVGKGEQEVFFDVELKRPDDAKDGSDIVAQFELILQADGFDDRLARAIPIVSPEIPVYATASGTSIGDASAWLELPADVPMRSTTLVVTVGPSVRRSLLDILFSSGYSPRQAHLIATPATDTGISNLMAAVALQKLLAQSREADQPHAPALDTRIRSEVGLLVAAQLDDGGWGWAGSRKASDRNVSARAVWALSLAKSAGYQVPDETHDKALSYLQGQLAQTDNADYESKAVLLHALAVAGQGDFALANRLHRNRPSLSTSALLHLALALNQMKRPSLANDALQLINAENFDNPLTRRKTQQASLPWNHSPVETRALYVLCLQDANPQSPLVKPLIDQLLRDRRGNRWSPDKATGPATMAICQWLAKTKVENQRFAVTVLVNGKAVKELTFDRNTQTQVLDVSPEMLKAKGKQQVQFRLNGRGQFTYHCSLLGFAVVANVKSKTSDWTVSRIYEPAPLERDGKPIARGFDVVRGSYQSFHNALNQLPIGRRGEVSLRIRRSGVSSETPVEHLEYLIVTEPLPAGVAVVEDSVRGSFDHFEISPGKITFFVSNRFRWSDIQYSVHGYIEGDYQVMPTIVRDAYRPDQMAIAKPHELTVLPFGAESKDEYRMTPRELFELGRFAFQDKDASAAIEHLEKLSADWRLRPEVEKEATSILLDSFLAAGPSRKVVHYFEIVKEKYPDMEVPYEKIVKIGRAYHEMGEFERCFLIFRATVESSFLADSRVAGFLQKQNEPLRSVEFMNDLLREYPPEPYAAAALFDLAQQVYALSAEASQNKRLRDQKITRVDLIRRSGGMLIGFLSAYPNDPAADQAAFSLANAMLDLEQYERAIEACQKFAERYPDSEDVDGFWYTIGFCHFALGQHDQALEVCQRVVDMKRLEAKTGRMVPSDNRERAIYILGQIYHSLGKAAKAIQEYTRVKDQFADAKEAIDYFTRREISLPEVTRVKPGDPVEFNLDFRNVTDCTVQVYRIDLMKYGILQRNLADITSINLAGIKALHEEQLTLGDGKDYRDRQRSVQLPLKVEGAYLVVCRAHNLHASGLVLISGLRVDIQQDDSSGRVRTTVKEQESDAYVSAVHVKVIGSANDAFVSGETDLRGVFVADGINGEATVIAQLDNNRYAFFRGSRFLGPRARAAPGQSNVEIEEKAPQGRPGRRSLLLEGLKGRNSVIQADNYKRQQEQYFNEEEGVRVEAVK